MDKITNRAELIMSAFGALNAAERNVIGFDYGSDGTDRDTGSRGEVYGVVEDWLFKVCRAALTSQPITVEDIEEATSVSISYHKRALAAAATLKLVAPDDRPEGMLDRLKLVATVSEPMFWGGRCVNVDADLVRSEMLCDEVDV